MPFGLYLMINRRPTPIIKNLKYGTLSIKCNLKAFVSARPEVKIFIKNIKSAKKNRPSASTTRSTVRPLSGWIARTVAPGSTPPLVSRTTPVSAPVLVCADNPTDIHTKQKTRQPRRILVERACLYLRHNPNSLESPWRKQKKATRNTDDCASWKYRQPFENYISASG
mgnify:CR=1 FL=1